MFSNVSEEGAASIFNVEESLERGKSCVNQ
jgi:hypothetical protein